MAARATNANVISELVVGLAGLRLSEPECGAGDEVVLVDEVVEPEREPVAPEPEPEPPEPEPPHPASAPAASSTAAPAAGTRIRMRRANSTIDTRG